MANFFTFILIIFLIFLFFGIGFISNFVRVFLKQAGGNSNNNQKEYYSNSNNNHTKEKTSDNAKKVFTKDEGEYIEYEEIKDC